MSTVPPVAAVPVRRRTVALAGGGVEVRHLVPCAASGGSSPLAECGSCARCLAMPVAPDDAGAEVHCRPEVGETRVASRELSRMQLDLVELALRTPVRDVVRPVVLAARADLSVRAARALSLRSESLLLVDADSRPEGVVRPSVLASADVDPEATLASVAAPLAGTVRDDTALVHTLAALGEGDGAVLPVVDDEGALLAVLTAADVVRWLAKRAGYDL